METDRVNVAFESSSVLAPMSLRITASYRRNSSVVVGNQSLAT